VLLQLALKLTSLSLKPPSDQQILHSDGQGRAGQISPSEVCPLVLGVLSLIFRLQNIRCLGQLGQRSCVVLHRLT